MFTNHILPPTKDRQAEACPDLLTEGEAARYLRLDCDDVTSAMKRLRVKGLHAASVGRQLLYRRKELIEFCKQLEIGNVHDHRRTGPARKSRR